MLSISVSDKFRSLCPHFCGAAIYVSVKNTSFNPLLWEEINKAVSQCKTSYTIDSIKMNPAISATRDAYKQLGKDPNRYRPSAEALYRRILRNIPLYQINTLVDLINLVSIRTGYSIGGFDISKIEGDSLSLGIGMADEPYEGIGRGMLNIEGLPVYRDAAGGIGTPTSDNERTKIDINTAHLLTVVNSYNGKEGLEETIDYMQSLLKEFAASDGGTYFYF